jgi:5-methylcytosine-specific restriction endonuclease McrBC regulatory subunit McrC
MIRTTDNNRGRTLSEIGGENTDDLKIIANRSLTELQKDYPNLLVFPKALGQYHDDVEKASIFSLHEGKLTTYNIMGFVGINDTQLTITSRFAKDDKHDYFLHNMLGKVLSINIVNLDTKTDADPIQDFLPYLFPAYLKNALTQGIYKQYQRDEYNNANVRGVVDVSRHIRLNIPFAGKIAYNTREYRYDNSMTELIRHTIEHIRTSPMFSAVLTADPDTRADVQRIIEYTPLYNKNDRRKIIDKNRKPVPHPYFTEYLPLQRLCLQILQYEKVSFGMDKDQIHGLLFDGAWLWEEYLYTILKNDFTHPRNKTGEGREHLLVEQEGKPTQEIYPDYISKDRTADKVIIADAKYKHLENSNEEYGRDDYFQLLAYMYRFKSKRGFLLFPYGENSGCQTLFSKKYEINGTDGELTKLGLVIPQQSDSYRNFCAKIEQNEKSFRNADLGGIANG